MDATQDADVYLDFYDPRDRLIYSVCNCKENVFVFSVYYARFAQESEPRPRRQDVNAMYISFHNLEERQLLTLS